MSVKIGVTAHALAAYRSRVDPRATTGDVLAAAQSAAGITRHSRRGAGRADWGTHSVYAGAGGVLFVLAQTAPGRYKLVTVLTEGKSRRLSGGA